MEASLKVVQGGTPWVQCVLCLGLFGSEVLNAIKSVIFKRVIFFCYRVYYGSWNHLPSAMASIVTAK